ncbi:uncharacterized protein [Amphiura filiformis]|uniref:uncharacterized protein n=1 Tax=Amphiura filiformis TaxID=82378 RepID=UPI003B210F75
MPNDARTALYEAHTLSRCNKVGHYQGGDANLEELNKEVKQHVSCTGVPTRNQWQQVFRNLPKMKKVRQATLKDVGMEDQYEQSEKKLAPKPVGCVRVVLRKCEYLAHPFSKMPHQDIESTEDMDTDLENFVERASKMKEDYISNKIDGEDHKNPIIPVTAAEAENSKKITSKTVKEIDSLIMQALDTLPDNNLASVMEEDYRKHFKRKSKALLIEFYFRVQEELESAESFEDDDSNDNIN